MINIVVTGNTYDNRRLLKQSGFQWNPHEKVWWKRETEARINGTLEDIRPPVTWSENDSPRIKATLTKVDMNGRPMSSEVLVIEIKPEGERDGTDYFELFNKVCDGQVITVNCGPSPPDSEKKKEVKNVDDAFF